MMIPRRRSRPPSKPLDWSASVRWQAPAIVLAALLLAPSNCPADQSQSASSSHSHQGPTAAERAAERAAKRKRAREAACEKKLRADLRAALDGTGDPDPPVPLVCRRLDRATQKRIATRVTDEELQICPAEKPLKDCDLPPAVREEG